MEKYVLEETVYNTVDEDGVIHEHVNRRSLQRVRNEPFFMVYIDQLRFFYESPLFNASTKVLFKLLEYADFNEGKAFINSERVKEITVRCKIGKSTYYTAIDMLKKEGLIEGDNSTYTINANVFWKGEKKVRKEIVSSRPEWKFAVDNIMPDPEE